MVRFTVAVGTSLLVVGVLSSSSAAGPSTPMCHGHPATVVGTSGADEFINDDLHFDDVVVLRGGNDVVWDVKQDLTVCGNQGEDQIWAFTQASGSKTLFDGGRGDDSLGSAEDLDFTDGTPLHIVGGGGHDTIWGNGDGPKGDSIQGGRGDDGLYARTGEDVVRGGAGDDTINGGGQDDRLFGNAGRDDLKGDAPEQLPGHDYANGGPQTDHCEAEVKIHCES